MSFRSPVPINNSESESFSLMRIILVDDQHQVHDAITQVLKHSSDIQLVGQVYRGEDAISLCRRARPDLVLMDVVMPGMSGIETTRALLKQQPNLKILALSSFREYEYIKAMLDSGAIGYLVKDAIAQDLINTIRNTIHGNTVFSPDVARVVLDPPSDDPAVDFGLTDRESQVLEHMANGLTNGQIAAALGISQPTVRFHNNNILLKLKVETRSEALVLAAKNRLV